MVNITTSLKEANRIHIRQNNNNFINANREARELNVKNNRNNALVTMTDIIRISEKVNSTTQLINKYNKQEGTRLIQAIQDHLIDMQKTVKTQGDVVYFKTDLSKQGNALHSLPMTVAAYKKLFVHLYNKRKNNSAKRNYQTFLNVLKNKWREGFKFGAAVGGLSAKTAGLVTLPTTMTLGLVNMGIIATTTGAAAGLRYLATETQHQKQLKKLAEKGVFQTRTGMPGDPRTKYTTVSSVHTSNEMNKPFVQKRPYRNNTNLNHSSVVNAM